MPLLLDEFSARARTKHIKTGRRYGSSVVLAQADDTLEALDALAAMADQLAEKGFSRSDGERLADGRAALLESGVLKDVAEADAQAKTQAFQAELKRGKQARRDSEAILTRVQTVLDEKGNEAAAQAIEIALRGGGSSGSDADKLRAQLQGLRAPLAREDVAEAAADRGGAAAIAAIDASLAELRSIEQVRPTKRGTPAETERLDLIDGIVVDLVRSARRAARALAAALGQPSIAERFELEALYGGRPARRRARPTRTLRADAAGGARLQETDENLAHCHDVRGFLPGGMRLRAGDLLLRRRLPERWLLRR